MSSWPFGKDRHLDIDLKIVVESLECGHVFYSYPDRDLEPKPRQRRRCHDCDLGLPASIPQVPAAPGEREFPVEPAAKKKRA